MQHQHQRWWRRAPDSVLSLSYDHTFVRSAGQPLILNQVRAVAWKEKDVRPRVNLASLLCAYRKVGRSGEKANEDRSIPRVLGTLMAKAGWWEPAVSYRNVSPLCAESKKRHDSTYLVR
jgi:hypothetical protein